jgi:hypothetical protein
MKTTTTAPDYKGFRFPAEVISHTVWLSFRFSLSYRDIEELLAQRGIAVTYETVRQWCLKFGQTYANELRRRRPQCGDKWHAGRACFSRSVGNGRMCGEPLISMATCWISLSKAAATSALPNDFFANFSRDFTTSHV